MDSSCARRGQGASGAAILIAIIGGMFVLYILFLPPSFREELLFGDQAGGGQGGGPSVTGGGSGGVFAGYGPTLILTAVPGTLRLQRSPVEEHTIPSATIFTSVQTQEIKSIDSALVKSGVFSSRGLEITFEASKGTGNYLLSFNVPKAASSPLRVEVNGQPLFERILTPGTPPPIMIPADILVEGENRITLSTEGVGLAFWKSNAYYLTNILISADTVDTSGSMSQQTFSVSEREMLTMERAELQFVPECDPRKAGRLTVQLNSRFVRGEDNQTIQLPNTLYTGFVDCGVLFKTEVPREFLQQGVNTMLFASDGGQYVIDRIKLLVYLPENDYPVYYFNLAPDMFDALDQGASVARLTLNFADYRVLKRGEVVINGFVQSFETNDLGYQALIDPAILTPGPNSIQVIPRVDALNVAEVRVELL